MSRGTVRWSVALDGPYVVHSGLWTRSARLHPQGDDPNVGTTAGLLIYVEVDTVRAVDRLTGKVRWRARVGAGLPQPLEGPYGFPVVAGDGVVAVPVSTGGEDKTVRRVDVLDAVTGRQVAKLPWPEEFTNSDTAELHAVVAGRLIFSGERSVAAIDARTGKIAWRHVVRRHYGTVLLDGVLYLGARPLASKAAGRGVERIEVRTGRSLGDLPQPAGLHAPSMVISQGLPGVLLFYTKGPSGVAAIDPRTGRLLWSHHGGRDGQGVIEAVDALARSPLVYFRRSSNEPVQVVNAQTGTVVYGHVPHSILRSFNGVVRGVTVTAEREEHSVSGVDAASDQVRWRVPGVEAFGRIAAWDRDDPALVVGVACAPEAVRDSRADEETYGVRCAKPYLVAVNW
jgi:outer membrane protein assembly factor BamB